MKTFYKVIAATAIAALFSSAAFAEGTKIESSTLINASSNNGNLGLALGRNSTVNTGSISVKNGASVKSSTVINASQNSGNLGLALGRDSTVNTGSVDIQ
jgi:hypothetical protein